MTGLMNEPREGEAIEEWILERATGLLKGVRGVKGLRNELEEC